MPCSLERSGEEAAVDVEVPGAADPGRGRVGPTLGRGALEPQEEVGQRSQETGTDHQTQHYHVLTSPQVSGLSRGLSFGLSVERNLYSLPHHEASLPTIKNSKKGVTLLTDLSAVPRARRREMTAVFLMLLMAGMFYITISGDVN